MHSHPIPNDDLRRAITAICPQRFEPRHFENLRRLDRRLNRLAIEIESSDTPTRMPGYWRRWQSVERRLADILRHPAHPFLRTRFGLTCAHDGLRQLYWQSVWEAAS